MWPNAAFFCSQGSSVPQLGEVAIGEVGRQEGLVVEQDAAVSQFDGFHAVSSRSQSAVHPTEKGLVFLGSIFGFSFPIFLSAHSYNS